MPTAVWRKRARAPALSGPGNLAAWSDNADHDFAASLRAGHAKYPHRAKTSVGAVVRSTSRMVNAVFARTMNLPFKCALRKGHQRVWSHSAGWGRPRRDDAVIKNTGSFANMMPIFLAQLA
jgi:hypothetical protein